MATEDAIHVQVPRIKFCLKIPKISQLDEVSSPQFSLQDVQWYVKAVKEIYEGKDSLGVYLYPVDIDESSDHTRAASVSFKLLSWDKNTTNSVEEHTSMVFDKNESGFGSTALIAWDDLFSNEKNYVRNDTINVEINLEVADPNDENKSRIVCEKIDQCCTMGCSTTLRLHVTNIRNLIAVRSPIFTIYKLDWYLTVSKNNADQIGIELDLKEFDSETTSDAEELDDEKTSFQSKAKMLVKILSSKIKAKTVSLTKPIDSLGIENMALLDELIEPENGFINNDSIVIEIEIKIGCGLFDKSPNHQDAVKFKLECAICLEAINNQDISSTLCGHIFCTSCITNTIQINQLCPLCKNGTTLETLRRVYLPSSKT